MIHKRRRKPVRVTVHRGRPIRAVKREAAKVERLPPAPEPVIVVPEWLKQLRRAAKRFERLSK